MSGGGPDTQEVVNTTEIPPYLENAFQNQANVGQGLFMSGMGLQSMPTAQPAGVTPYSGFGGHGFGGLSGFPGALPGYSSPGSSIGPINFGPDSGGDTYFNQHVGPSDATSLGINQLVQQGLSGPALYGEAEDTLGGILGGGGITAPGANPYTSQIAGLGGGNALQQSVASGDLIGNNPHLEGVIDRGIEDITGAVNMAANARGLGGAGSNLMARDTLADNVASFVGDLRYGDYTNSLNTALGTASGLANQGLNAYGSAAGLYNTDANRNIGVQGQNIANQFGAIGALPGLDAYGDTAAQDLLTAGAMSEGYQQGAINDAAQEHYFYQNRPWELLGNMGAATGLAGSQPMSTTTTGPAQGGSPVLGALGGAGAGASLASAVGFLNPYTAPLALLGGLAGGGFI